MLQSDSRLGLFTSMAIERRPVTFELEILRLSLSLKSLAASLAFRQLM